MPTLQYVFKYLIKLIQPVKAGLAEECFTILVN